MRKQLTQTVPASGLGGLVVGITAHQGRDEVVAAIRIGVPLARCRVMALRRLAPAMVEAAEAASRCLGWSAEETSPSAVTRGLPGAPAAART